MAEKRMFAKSIVLSDVFLDMPLSTRCLYFTLGMMADDDGFVGSPKAIMRQCGASQDDLLLLLQKRYVLGFDNGIIVIKHWRINNYLQKDRHKATTYIEELATLAIDEKGAYTEKDKCIQNVYTDKNRLDKNSIDKTSSRFTPPSLEEVKAYIQEKGLNVDGDKFYEYFSVGHWIDSKGQKVKNWKQKLLTWDKKEPKKIVEAIPKYDDSNNVHFDLNEYDTIKRG